MPVTETLKTAYTIGGAGAVLVLVLIYAVITLWRKLQKEHEDRLAQARQDNHLMHELIETLMDTNSRLSRHGDELMDYDDSDEGTDCTYDKRDKMHRRARRILDSTRPR